MTLQDVINDYEKLLELDEGYDVIIYAGENEDVRELHAHSNILRVRSQYFHAAFSNDWAKKKDGNFILEKPNISSSLFKIILRFIYCGRVDMTKLEVPELLNLLTAADELNIQSLIPKIEIYLTGHKSSQQYLLECLEIIYKREHYTKLLEFYLYRICADPESFVNSDKFISMTPPLLEFLLKRDDFCLKEIVIWDSLLRWALAQHPAVPKDFTEWSEEEITIIEKTLHSYIPLVRFCHISSEDFHDKIYPLKDLLPKDLVSNLLTFYLVPSRKTSIDKQLPRRSKYKYDSVIAEFQHFALFANWIDKKDDQRDDLREIRYKFNLLYRASRDGDTIKEFHEKTGNTSKTVLFIAKIKGTNQIIGGCIGGLKRLARSTNSFVFSFEDYRDIGTGKIGRVKSEYSVHISEDYGPVFGAFDEEKQSSDIMLRPNGKWCSYPFSYPDIDIPTDFEVEDYEVFEVPESFLSQLSQTSQNEALANFFQNLLANKSLMPK